MQVHFGVDQLQAEWPKALVCVGTFDGVHLGHQAVIRQSVSHAREAQEPAILVTFDRHPAAVLAPERCPPAIASIPANLRMFESLSVAVTVMLPFTYDLSQTSAEDFYQTILVNKLRASAIVVGHDFAFGHGRLGTAEWLKERIETTIVPPFELDGLRVSSSAIRAAILDGRVEHARRWLGRPFELFGVVVPGQRLGRTIGYPTANLARSFNQAVPRDGVYACEAQTDFGVFRAAVGIGVRPTIESDGQRTIEAYLLDFPGTSLYGTSMSLRFLKRLRNEERFDSVEALKVQMESDVALARIAG
ncbi:MAG: bifunctional riboflavin kinase/FAD synthetase [Fimbriimonadaceae bacterium]|nr:bifunctional riboflavin kinase/FAD synthetase [Fimbriimonadaceae bacterium]